jgi:NAD(P)H-hydrate epimerase
MVVAGSVRMAGAAYLATTGALRGGSGLVTVATPRSVQPILASLCPCALSLPLDCDDNGQLAGSAIRQVLLSVKNDVFAVGPGMDQGVVQQNLVQALLEQSKPCVIDADGLNNLSQIADWPLKVPRIAGTPPGSKDGQASWMCRWFRERGVSTASTPVRRH